jgi:hypothetical protein
MARSRDIMPFFNGERFSLQVRGVSVCRRDELRQQDVVGNAGPAVRVAVETMCLRPSRADTHAGSRTGFLSSIP